MRNRIFAFVLALLPLPAGGEESREFSVSVSSEIEASGLMSYILPRFALKTGRRGSVVAAGGDLRLGPQEGQGVPVMARDGQVFVLVLDSENEAARRFADWILSDIGQTTLAAFAPADGLPFGPAPTEERAVTIEITGDAVRGREMAEMHCARCHRVGTDADGMGIGSAPSFAALRTLPDWAERFAAFYVLNPHPAFLQVSGVTPPFDPALPPPIVPVEISADEVEALSAFAAGIRPADLGADILSR